MAKTSTKLSVGLSSHSCGPDKSRCEGPDIFEPLSNFQDGGFPNVCCGQLLSV
jgi:hypothetical protein